MMIINLAKDGFRFIEGNRVGSVNYIEGAFPCSSPEAPRVYGYWRPSGSDELPPIAERYEVYEKAGYAYEKILDRLIEEYCPVHFFHPRSTQKIQKVVGMIGPRGGGKSCGAVHAIIFDWLIRGKPVLSNLDITVRVCYKKASRIFKTIPIETLDLFNMDVDIENGVLFVDEINMVGAEGSRYMSKANLVFATMMQQIRKKSFSVVWTCQNYNSLDSRMKFQNDLVVDCRDSFLSGRSSIPGYYSDWTVYDLSGMTGLYDLDYELQRGHYITNFKINQLKIFNRPYWTAYDTKQLQGEESYIDLYNYQQQALTYARKLEIAEARAVPAKDLVKKLVDSGVTSFYADTLWEENNIKTPGEKANVGRQLKRYFNRKRDNSGKYFYELKDMVVIKSGA